jgi:hypothetical protein
VTDALIYQEGLSFGEQVKNQTSAGTFPIKTYIDGGKR